MEGLRVPSAPQHLRATCPSHQTRFRLEGNELFRFGHPRTAVEVYVTLSTWVGTRRNGTGTNRIRRTGIGGPEQEPSRTRKTESGTGTEEPRRKPGVTQTPQDSRPGASPYSSFHPRPLYIHSGNHTKSFYNLKITNSCFITTFQ